MFKFVKIICFKIYLFFLNCVTNVNNIHLPVCIFFFLENLIRSACLNTAQNLISDINSQNETFVRLTKRLVEIREKKSSESIPYGII